MKLKNSFSIVLLSIVSSNTVFAEDDFGFYVGAGVGGTIVSDFDGLCNLVSGDCDDTDVTYKFFGGYKFNDYFSIEGGYVDLGEVSTNGVLIADTSIQQTISAESDGFTVSGIASWPLTEKLDIYGKVGAYIYNIEVEASGSTGAITLSQDEDEVDVVFGIGSSYDVSDKISLRAEWEHYDSLGNDVTGEANVDAFTASFIYQF